jgi:hypothetical protein
VRTLKSWKLVNNPAAFQGSLKKKKYFEGWYNKLVSADEKSIFTFIPTIAMNKRNGTSHCAIQFYDGIAGKAEYFKYQIKQFKNLSEFRYKVRIGKNLLSENGMKIDIDKNGYRIHGVLKYTELVPWKKKLFQPGVMGILSYFPLLETYHGIVSMNHVVNGTLHINGTDIIFNKGKGYIEKDWGRSFPSSWIWMHSNHFNETDLAFTFSIAKIPFLNLKVNGFLCIIWYQNRYYKFTTYTRARILKLEIGSNEVEVVIKNRKYILIVRAIKGSSVDLKAPRLGVMEGHCIESMTSKIRIKLLKLNNSKDGYDIIIDDYGRNAGLEIMDNNEFS